ncbi:hypothetical protein LTR53_014854 [Teratosphaeriaceae sp. CCFEE 6253]|nr:hypothetical protein LTR53_014854 [Teratosphaeriaceae sp. CCFEE 6253]
MLRAGTITPPPPRRVAMPRTPTRPRRLPAPPGALGAPVAFALTTTAATTVVESSAPASPAPSLPGSLGSSGELISQTRALVRRCGYKSKEVDSGVRKWETPAGSGVVAAPPAAPPLPAPAHGAGITFVYRGGIPGFMPPTPTRFVDDFGPRFPMAVPPVITIRYFRDELDEAQLHYPARNCLLVGNLSNRFDALTLNVVLLDLFLRYGDVYDAVYYSVNAGGTVMPYAIMQFADYHECLAAKLHLMTADEQGHKFDGRYLRVSSTTANRTIIACPRTRVTPST